jgi:3-hydroxyisobutyrate dehydrogenase-like beta-hydroxyacid dehydrogenase
VGLALKAAQELKAPMPRASLIADRFLTLIASGGAPLYWSALALVARRDAGEETALAKPRK